MWAVCGFVYYYDEWSPLGIKIMYEYFLYVYDKAFKYDGGIGGFFEDANPATELNQMGRYMYDGIFNFFVLAMIFEIVLGIIIDTFACKRDEEKAQQYDMNSKCFMCGKERGDYDVLLEERDRFLSHTENQHNKWNYVYYIGYLLDKDKNDYTGNEQYIAE